jgi:hypothetical protein
MPSRSKKGNFTMLSPLTHWLSNDRPPAACRSIIFLVILAYAYASQQHFESKVVEEFQLHQLARVRGASSAIQERLREVKVELLERLAPAIPLLCYLEPSLPEPSLHFFKTYA